MLRVVQVRRRSTAPFVGRLALRILQAAQRFRRLRNAARLFRKVIYGRGVGWIPRPWFERRGRLLR